MVKKGFIHREPDGIRAIDQKGARRKLAETRLYLYADESEKVIYLLTIGDKGGQEKDVNWCRRYVRKLKRGT